MNLLFVFAVLLFRLLSCYPAQFAGDCVPAAGEGAGGPALRLAAKTAASPSEDSGDLLFGEDSPSPPPAPRGGGGAGFLPLLLLLLGFSAVVIVMLGAAVVFAAKRRPSGSFAPDMRQTCPECGHKAGARARFCEMCGASLTSGEGAEAPAQTEGEKKGNDC